MTITDGHINSSRFTNRRFINSGFVNRGRVTSRFIGDRNVDGKGASGSIACSTGAFSISLDGGDIRDVKFLSDRILLVLWALEGKT